MDKKSGLRVVKLQYRSKKDPRFSLCLGPLPSLTLALSEDVTAETGIKQCILGLSYHAGYWSEKFILSKATEADFKICHCPHK